jgi:CHAD domain-containing protein
LRAVPDVLNSDDPKAVHRARVATRRMEENIAALFPKPYPKKIRKLRRALKRVRRYLGDWRNCDVVLTLMEKRRRRARSGAKQSAWKLAERYVQEQRGSEINRARRKVAAVDLSEISSPLNKLIERQQLANPPINADVEAVRDQWRSALAAAEKSRDSRDLHAFRIATKKLRYRLELRRELGFDSSELLAALKRLQRALGNWNDRVVLDQMIAEAIGRPKILLREFNAARTLLTELEKDGRQRNIAMEEIFRAAASVPAG